MKTLADLDTEQYRRTVFYPAIFENQSPGFLGTFQHHHQETNTGWTFCNTYEAAPRKWSEASWCLFSIHLQLVLSAIMLRRLKADIPDLNLPQRLVHKEECEFEEAEQFVYDQLSDRAAERLREAEQVESILFQ